MSRFEDFKNGVGGSLCRRMLRIDLTHVNSWAELRAYVQAEAETLLPFWQAEAYSRISTGEKPIIEAIMFFCDYRDQADRVANSCTYYRLPLMDADHRKTYMAIMSAALDC